MKHRRTIKGLLPSQIWLQENGYHRLPVLKTHGYSALVQMLTKHKHLFAHITRVPARTRWRALR